MNAELRRFEADLDRFVDETIPNDVRDLRDAIALEVHKGVVMMTPVDEGRARANWQVTAGTPAEGFQDIVFGGNAGAAANHALSAAPAVIAAARDPWMPIWIHNGVPYIRILNDGGAGRRAWHMVEVTVNRIRRMFK